MKLKHVIVLLFCLLFSNLNSQSFCLDLEEISNDGNVLELRIMISGDLEFGLGSSNFQFAFNASALENPTLISTPLSEFPPYFYSSLTVTNPSEGEASFNIELASASTFSFLVTPAQQEIVQISFDIIDENQSMDLEWSYTGSSTQTVVFHENETDQLFVTELACLETSEAVLPVDLISFTAVSNEQHSILNWKTAIEINTSHFDIERSDDLNKWEKIAEIKAQGTTFEATSYQYIDKEAKSNTNFKGNCYYRLNIIDIDGSREYSNIQAVGFEQEKNQGEILVYPNPTTNHITIETGGFSNAKSILLTDLSGRVIINIPIKSIKSTYVLSLEELEFDFGIYLLQLRSRHKVLHSEKVFKR